MHKRPDYTPATPAKIFFLSGLISICALLCRAQTSSISGIVNSYYAVTEVIPSISALKVTSTAGLSVNKRVLLVQMKGADINTSNSSDFGDTTALNEAGNYETAIICQIRTDTVYFYHTLLNSYDAIAGKVQMVLMAEYYSALVTDTIKAAAWNNTTGTGGVIALFCDQDITLNAPIYADSSGYRGGSFVASSGSCSNLFPANAYYYTASSTSPQNGAWKGEGIATVIVSQSGGRGAPANGGGGGNNHNNSGGGGANLNAGGIGGGNSSTAGCTTTLRGLAGKALSSWGGEKIFLGGGGGAGHSNGAIYTKGGGNGGGIIFIHANNMNGNGYKISANGGAGGQSQSDGAGGGGAGGTVIADITTYTGAVTIETRGGNGGNSDDGGNVGRCYGGGGGGSGGVIYFSGSAPAITVNANGGAAGLETGRDVSCAAAVAAGAGSNGQIIENYLYKRSTNPASGCGVALPFKLYSFTAEKMNTAVWLEWKIESPELVSHFIIEKQTTAGEWQRVQTLNAIPFKTIYAATDPNTVNGKSYYRLTINEKSGKITYSPVRLVDLGEDQPEFIVYPNPAKNILTVKKKDSAVSELKIMDLSAKIIFQIKLIANPATISLPLLAPGIYIIQIGGVHQKLIIH
jgi:hypothetical protein